jgi:hypothetical protein
MSDKSQQIIQLYSQGLPIYEISKRLKTSYSYVQYTVDPNHTLRKQRRERLKRVIAEKAQALIDEEPEYQSELVEVIRGMKPRV